jgi:uncharacterized membrane protein YraQ (UPF0718 family)
MKEDMKKKKRKSMIRAYILLGIGLIIAVIILLIFPDRLDTVANASREYFTEMMMILPAVMVIMGLFTVWISKDIMVKYLGKASGIKGIFLSIFLGALPTGPLYIAFPVAATLLKKGACISNVIVFLSAWACIKIPQEMVEIQFLGLNFMASRLILTIVFVSLIGVTIEHMIEWSDKKAIESKR